MGEITCTDVECRRGNFRVRVNLLRIRAGEKIALLGENGCGKTTLLQALAGLLPLRAGGITYGSARWDRFDAEERARHMAYLPQEAGVLFNVTVDELLDLALFRHGDGPPPLRGGARAAAVRAAAMEDFGRRNFQELSGGEKRRAMLARILCRGRAFTLLDEPTAPLDMRHAALIMRHVAGLPTAVVAAMHDVNLALRYFERFLLMKDGRIVFDVSREALETAMLEKIYGIGLTRHSDFVVPEL